MASIEDKKVLIVDDDENSLLIAKILFKNRWINLKISKNGTDAINFIKENLFDIILMDIKMPWICWIEATKKIRQHLNWNDKTKIITYTAYTKPIILEILSKQGLDEKFFDEYLTKPITQWDIDKIISEAQN